MGPRLSRHVGMVGMTLISSVLVVGGAGTMTGAAAHAGTSRDAGHTVVRHQAPRRGLFLVDTETGRRSLVAPIDSGTPWWPSPDGRHVLCYDERARPADTSGRVALDLLDLSGRRQARFGPFLPSQIVWRPDGRQFLIVEVPESGRGRLRLVDLTTRGQRTLASVAPDADVGWVRMDGWQIVLTRGQHTDLVDPVTGGRRLFASRTRALPSPDGRWLLLEQPGDLPNQSVLTLVRAQDGTQYPLTHRAQRCEVWWEQDGAAVLYEQFTDLPGDRYRIRYRCDVATLKPQILRGDVVYAPNRRWFTISNDDAPMRVCAQDGGCERLPVRSWSSEFSPQGDRLLLLYERQVGRRSQELFTTDAGVYEPERRQWRPLRLAGAGITATNARWLPDGRHALIHVGDPEEG